MTDQTVPVPVDLLRALEASVRGTAWDTVQTDAPPLGTTVRALTAFIPTLPKVGDTLTEEQIKELPRRAVVRDKDGDLWVSSGVGVVTLLGFNYDGRVRNDGGTPGELADYKPVLVLLPEDK